MNNNKYNIPQGYKDSPLGVIPEEWEVKKLGEIGDFKKGKGVPKDRIIHKGNKCLTYGDIYTKYDIIMKNVKSFIDDKVAEISQEINNGDILFAGSGETLEDIGKTIVYLDHDKAYAGGDIIIFQQSNLHSLWLTYVLNCDIVNAQKYKMGQGHSVVHIYSSQLEHLKIPLPPLPEQQAIADILSTWDNAIEKYEALLKRYELRKKGLMQRLLSGEGKNWKEVKLKNLCKISKGQQLNKIELESTGEYPSYSGGISPSGFTDEWNTNKNTIIISEGGNSCGYVNFITTNFWCGGHCYALLELKSKIIRDFLFHNLKFNESNIMNLRVGSGLPNIQKKDIENFKLLIPSIEEQNRIANILQTADQEISLLKEKIEQLREQKKGLMQVLLTGRKRVGADLLGQTCVSALDDKINNGQTRRFARTNQ